LAREKRATVIPAKAGIHAVDRHPRESGDLCLHCKCDCKHVFVSIRDLLQ
jgi:hypothetical protein